MGELYVEEHPPCDTSAASPPSIIFIHGGASSGRMYEDVIPLLQDRGYHLLVPDLPGHGRSRAEATTEKQKVFTFQNAVAGLVNVIRERKNSTSGPITMVGISLGGQVVLALLAQHPEIVERAVVSGVSIHPPDEHAAWEMPHLPLDDSRWMQILQEDVERMGMENAQSVQDQSFGFVLDLAPAQANQFPPTLVLVGEHDVAMAERDFDEVVGNVMRGNEKSRGRTLAGAWHNHSIDVPELFADVVDAWARALEA